MTERLSAILEQAKAALLDANRNGYTRGSDALMQINEALASLRQGVPSRAEQSICFANVPELFDKDHYWSNTVHAAHAAHAWYQTFYDGYQRYWHKDYALRARAVRRVAIGRGR